MSETQDFVQAIEQATGRQGKKAGRHFRLPCPAHDDHTPSLDVAEGADGKPLVQCRSAGCSWEDICREIDWQPKQRADSIVATYPYEDEHGKLLFEVVRLEPKTFRQRRPARAGDHPDKIKDGYVWNLKKVRRVLYKLPQLVEHARAGGTVYIAEGEKDVHALRAPRTRRHDEPRRRGRR